MKVLTLLVVFAMCSSQVSSKSVTTENASPFDTHTYVINKVAHNRERRHVNIEREMIRRIEDLLNKREVIDEETAPQSNLVGDIAMDPKEATALLQNAVAGDNLLETRQNEPRLLPSACKPNPCLNNGGCWNTYDCGKNGENCKSTPITLTYFCQCQAGYTGTRCENAPSGFACLHGKWKCPNADKCIYQGWRCDGYVQCPNGVDELPENCGGWNGKK